MRTLHTNYARAVTTSLSAECSTATPIEIARQNHAAALAAVSTGVQRNFRDKDMNPHGLCQRAPASPARRACTLRYFASCRVTTVQQEAHPNSPPAAKRARIIIIHRALLLWRLISWSWRTCSPQSNGSLPRDQRAPPSSPANRRRNIRIPTTHFAKPDATRSNLRPAGNGPRAANAAFDAVILRIGRSGCAVCADNSADTFPCNHALRLGVSARASEFANFTIKTRAPQPTAPRATHTKPSLTAETNGSTSNLVAELQKAKRAVAIQGRASPRAILYCG